jgi:putative tricarboxylic transport membrane protein
MADQTRSELRRDLVVSLGLLCLAVAYGVKAQQIPGSSLIGKGIGAGAVPTALAIALGCFSLMLLLRATRGLRRLGGETRLTGPKTAWRETMKPHLRAFGMLIIGIVFISLLEELGYLVAIALLLAATAWYNGQKQLKPLLLFAVGGAIAYDLLFVQLLGIALPSGFWPTLFAPLLGGN